MASSIRKDNFKSKNVRLSSAGWLARRDRVKEASWETLDSVAKTWEWSQPEEGKQSWVGPGLVNPRYWDK